MKEAASRRLHQGSLKLKLLLLLRHQLLFKTILLVYYLMNYVPCSISESVFLDSLFLYSSSLCTNTVFNNIMMVLELIVISFNIVILYMLKINLPSINIRYLLIIMYAGIIESIIATVVGLIFSINSHYLGIQIAGSLICVGVNIWVILVRIEIPLFKMGKRVMHYHKLKVRYNAMRGRVTGIDGA